jgi:hypothetical protein
MVRSRVLRWDLIQKTKLRIITTTTTTTTMYTEPNTTRKCRPHKTHSRHPNPITHHTPARLTPIVPYPYYIRAR